ncbi:hypothetical protein R3W88_011827 [Solanum pinnatisectum]|uniref:DUF4283 domain-containing protein n=1 Tax=Solanum pinnatisectum TaxID=50273 RepID=A0AAV9LA46_9SOLN|nr:hypothetical protein R3W88_011827 [Solanum pinnatisectum]
MLVCTNLHLAGNGEGQQRREARRHHEEEILHGLTTSSNSKEPQTTKLMYEPLPTTPEGATFISKVKSIQDKRKTAREEHWLELSQHKGTGAESTLNNTTPEKPWANLFTTNRMVAIGMNLTYIALIIVEGEKVVEILAEDIVESGVKWRPSVVIYMVGETPSIEAMERFIVSQGNFSSKPVVLYHVDGYFVVRFENGEDRERVGTFLFSQIKAPPPKKDQVQGQRKKWKLATVEGKDRGQQINITNVPQGEWQIVRHIAANKGLRQLEYTRLDDTTPSEDNTYETRKHCGRIKRYLY